jgi:Flp pilus assembly protein protease CpaA
MKPWWKSKTIITNCLVIVIAAVAAVAQEIYGGPVIDVGTQAVAGTVGIAIINLILRTLTGQPLG